MAFTSEQLLTHLYYHKLPEVYRSMDKDDTLKRFLTSLVEGGYQPLLESTNKMSYLVDPMQCPDEIFPYLFESFGYTYDVSVPIIYQRRILLNHGELKKRRGTISYVHFLVSTLTGMDCTLEYYRGLYRGTDDRFVGKSGRFLEVSLLANTYSDIMNLQVSTNVVEKFLSSYYIPFYITPVVTTKVQAVTIEAETHYGVVVTQKFVYTLPR